VELKSLLGNVGGALIKSWGALIYGRLFTFFWGGNNRSPFGLIA